VKTSRGSKIDAIEQKQARRVFVLISLAAVMTLAVLYRFPIASSPIYPQCPWYWLTNTYCPGCGSLRGLSLVAHGDMFGLWRNNALAFIAMPYLLYAYLSLIVSGFAGYRLPQVMFSKSEKYAIIGFIVLFTVVRNFSEVLAPEPF